MIKCHLRQTIQLQFPSIRILFLCPEHNSNGISQTADWISAEHMETCSFPLMGWTHMGFICMNLMLDPQTLVFGCNPLTITTLMDEIVVLLFSFFCVFFFLVFCEYVIWHLG